MPELPEVETIVRDLAKKVVNRKISGFSVLTKKMARTALHRAVGRKVVKVSRRGKLIIIKLTGGLNLLIHLKMTGQLLWNQEADKHVHICLEFGRDRLCLRDIRKFGFVDLVDEAALREVLEKKFAFGPEPLGSDFNTEHLVRITAGKKVSIKALLLNQTKVAGIGNIYADESLHRAGIRPTRPAGSLTRLELLKLLAAIKEVLKEAVKAGGSSSQDYVRLSGKKGAYQKQHRVYRKTGQPCFNCGRPITRTVVAGRGTHYCEYCQKK